MKKTTPDLQIEQQLWEDGLSCIAGLDEAGRGSWAGPVCAAAVILPNTTDLLDQLEGVRDSKCMTAKQRRQKAGIIKQTATTWAAAFASSQEIDRLGIIAATRLAMMRALQGLKLKPQHLIIDALKIPESEIPQTSLIKGDAKCLSIAAASILAKTMRDELLQKYGRHYPQYGFGKHKGYGTRMHRKNLNENGPCSIHRMSFAPLHPWGETADQENQIIQSENHEHEA